MLLLFFGAGLAASFMSRKRSVVVDSLTRGIDEVIGIGVLGRIRARLRFELLATIFFTLAGAVALGGCVLNQAPDANRFFACMALSVGLGMALGLLLQTLRDRRR